MNSERWERIHLLFEEAVTQPDEVRRVFIDSACGDDHELRDEVVSLIAAHERSDEIEALPTVWMSAVGRPKGPGFATDDHVAGRYLIQRLLGRGGMGEVYEAWDEELSISVALKTLHLAGSTDEALKSLKLEGLLARSIWHPNVCRVYDLGRHGEGKGTVWFLTMELLRGETLSDRLQNAGRLPLDRVLRFAEEMAAGLGAAHRAGVVHRDFKTSNVMLVAKDGGAEQAVVTDFGTARTASRTALEEDGERASAMIIGTPAYMAPEQVVGGEVGPAADIYALGIVLYEMVTGVLPFTGSSALEVARRRLDAEPLSPRSVLPKLDDRWEAVILRCLARDPSRRFGRAEEVGEALAGRGPVEGEVRDLSTRAQHTLPAERDSFVGREMETKELDRSLSNGSRLVTLLGVGGMGKTRLAVHYAWGSLAEWPGGVWFCDLTDARTLNGIASAVAVSLGVQLGGGDPLVQLAHAIEGRRRCLMILDNFEQVVEHGEETLGLWLEQATQARFIVTSRERLNLSGEIVQAVEPLSIDMGMELFVTRARGLRPGLELAGLEAKSAREIVRLVDGMPLAIELAAARMRVMSAAQILAQMRKRFQLLTGGQSARHETLEMTINGSWELLSPWEQGAWAQCSVFEGGFTLEAAEGILDLSTWPEAPWLVDVVQSLVDKSLLRSWVAGGPRGAVREIRFGMYASLQDYARTKLRQAGWAAAEGTGRSAEQAAEERHGSWYAQYGTQEAMDGLEQHGGVERRQKLERELGNLVTGCRRALEREDGETAAALYRASWPGLLREGPIGAAVDLGLEVLRNAGLGRSARAIVLTMLGNAERYSGRLEDACSYLESALAIHRETGNRLAQCIVLDNLSLVLKHQGHIDEGLTHAEAALAISREIGARRTEGGIRNTLGALHRHEGRMEEAYADYEAAIAIYREVGNRRQEGIVLSNLGILHYDYGQLDEARTHLEAALAIDREVGNRYSEGIVIGNLGDLHHDQGRLEEAQVAYEAALAIHREVGNRRFEGVVLTSLGNLCRAMGQMEAAREHLESALAIYREVGNRLAEGVAIGDLGVLHSEQGCSDEARACYELALAIHREGGNRRFEGIILGRLARLFYDQGRTEEAGDTLEKSEAILRQVDDRLELARLLCLRGEMELKRENVARAHAVLREVQAFVIQSGLGPDSEVGRKLAKVRQALAVKQ